MEGIQCQLQLIVIVIDIYVTVIDQL